MLGRECPFKGKVAALERSMIAMEMQKRERNT